MAPQVEVTDILREQLEYLIEHSAGNAQCGCAECQRYLKVRAALLEIFADPPRAKVREIGMLAKAA
jgi:hypothetical protein